MKEGLVFSIIIILILISFVSAEGEVDPLYGKPQIDIKFTKAIPADSVESIGIVRTNEPFAIYGNVQNQPAEHYIKVVLPENCTFSGDSAQKSFNSKIAHNFKFIQFICNEQGIYDFKINLESNNEQILASDIESIYVNNNINIDDMKANPYIKKSFIYDGKTYTDKCVSLDDLKDDYPGFVDNGILWGVQDYILEDGNTISMPRFMCPPGGCKDGVCLKYWSNNCMDSDEGYEYGEDIFVKGNSSGNTRPDESVVTREDSCISLEAGRYKQVDSCGINEPCMIQEYFCSNSTGSLLYNYPILSDKIINCPNGCQNGACLPKNDSINFSCTDSDNGKNYYEKGTITGKRENGEFSTSTDKCVGEDNSLVELYCDKGISKYEFYICPYECKEGVCIDNDTTLNVLEGAESIDIPANDLESKIIYVCKGCALYGVCYPVGYRTENEYCNVDEFFKEQSEGPCGEDYECKSNECSDRGECKPSKGIFAQLIYWFKNWF